MTDSYDALREAAEKAAEYPAKEGWPQTSQHFWDIGFSQNEASYITAASPDVILRLLRDLNVARGGYENIIAERDQLRRQVAELEAHPPLSLDAKISADNAALREILEHLQWAIPSHCCSECLQTPRQGHKRECRLRALLETSA